MELINNYTHHLPDNVLQNIARYLEPIENEIKITIQQYNGCKLNTHANDDYCEACENRYKYSRMYIFLHKNSNKYIFKKFIDDISKITLNSEFPIKTNLSRWLMIEPKTKDYWTMGHFFKKTPSIIPISSMTSEEAEKYDLKYMITDIKYALFPEYIREIIYNNEFIIKKRDFIETVYSSSTYYIVSNINKHLKNNLAITNKIFQKYTYPNNLK